MTIIKNIFSRPKRLVSKAARNNNFHGNASSTSLSGYSPNTTGGNLNTHNINLTTNRLLIENPDGNILFINDIAHNATTFVPNLENSPIKLTSLKTTGAGSDDYFMTDGIGQVGALFDTDYQLLNQNLLWTTRLSMSKIHKSLEGAFIDTWAELGYNGVDQHGGGLFSLDKSSFYKWGILAKLNLNSQNCTFLNLSFPQYIIRAGTDNIGTGYMGSTSDFGLLNAHDLSDITKSLTLASAATSSVDWYANYFPVSYDETQQKIYAIAVTNYENVTSPWAKVFSLKEFSYTGFQLGHKSSANWNTATLTAKDYSLNAGNIAYGLSYSAIPNQSLYMGKDNSGNLHFLSINQDRRSVIGTAATQSDLDIVVTALTPSSSTTTTLINTNILGLTRTSWFNSNAGKCRGGFRIPSKFEQSPAVGESSVYYSYLPAYTDTAGTTSGAQSKTTTYFTPILFKWTKSNILNVSTSVTYKDCNIVYPGSNTWFDYANVYDITTGGTQQNVLLGSSFFKKNSQCLITKVTSSGRYFLSHIQCVADDQSVILNGGYASGVGKQLRIMTYEIDVANNDWNKLTYHSYAQFDNPVYSFLPVDETNFTKIMCLHENSLSFYQFNETNGWVKSFEQAGSFKQVTRDQQDRIWAYTVEAEDSIYPTYTFAPNKVQLHLISESANNVITLKFENTDVSYSGSNISNNVQVSFFDETNTRLARDVQLTIEGSNMVFTANGTNTITVTTLTTGEKSVPVTITGPGYNNVYATVVL